MERTRPDDRLPFLAREIERFGRERAIAAGLGRLGALAVLVIVGDRLEAGFGSAAVARVADDEILLRQMIEQRDQPLLEQGQPMVDAGDAAAFGHGLIERIAGGGGAEQFAIGGTEAFDAGFVEQGFGGGQQGEALDPADAALGGGVEAADAFDLVAEEIEPQRFVLARREEVDQAAAHGIFAGVGDRVGARIAVRLKQRRKLVAIDPLAGREPGDELANAERRQRPLQRRIDRGDEQLGADELALERVQGRQPLRRRSQRRRAAVVGQAVPGREGQRLELGREIVGGIDDRAHRRLVGRDEHGAGAAVRGRAREIGGEPGQEARGHAGQGHRPFGGQDLLKVGQFSPIA